MTLKCSRILLLAILCVPVGISHAENAFIIGGGMLAIDADLVRKKGLVLKAAGGQLLHGVVVIKPGLTVINEDLVRVIDETPSSLVLLDGNLDDSIDALDSYWDAMFLAVDYNGDGEIRKGEYALIGNCGVKALKLNPNSGEAWSVHTDGSTKKVGMPD